MRFERWHRMAGNRLGRPSLRALHRAQLRHGDTKATNIIISDRGPALVDLDAMRRYRSRWAFARAWGADMARFARNWAGDPELTELFATVMRDLCQARVALRPA